MGTTKSAYFSDEQNMRASVFKALGHPARLSILEHLLSVNSCICGDIVEEVKLAQPTVSQHLKELKSVGLIKGEVEGNSICYCVHPEAIKSLIGYLSKFEVISKSNCC